MIHLLSGYNISKHYGNKVLFEAVDFTLSPQTRVGLVGVNGSGKTTLLKLIVGEEMPDTGAVDHNPKARMAYLSQNPVMDETMTVLDYLFQGDSPTMQLLRDYERAVLALTQRPDDPRCQTRLTQLNQRMDMENGWAAESQAKAVLTRLGLRDFEVPLGQLSGGQRRRAALAQVLIDPADLLILDEPTNHIDPETIVWLEDYLAGLKTALLLVTHDRYFLDRIVTQILEIDGRQLHLHPGNYSLYLAHKAERYAQRQKSALERHSFLQRELAWLNRTPMARGSKQKARIQRIESLQEAGEDYAGSDLTLNVATRRTGKQILEIQHLSKQFDGAVIIEDFSYTVNRQARLGIIGPNGTGKTTLLNLIAGRLTPDSGQVSLGETIVIGYYDQESLALDESQRLIDYVSETADVIRTAKGDLISAAQMLEYFQFPRSMQYEYISTLSGGERRRLYLLRTLMMGPNFLLLDEPTNDLDIQTLSILEDYLDSFAGAVMVVSHDRYFLDRTVEHIFAFEGGGEIIQYPGNYSHYQHKKAAEAESVAQVAAPDKRKETQPPAKPSTNRPRRLTYQERRELAGLEERITDMETEKEALTTAINSVGSDYQRLQMLSASLTQIEADLETAIERWAELSEIAEGA